MYDMIIYTFIFHVKNFLKYNVLFIHVYIQGIYFRY